MKIGTKDVKVVEVKDKLVDAHRAYRDGKSEAFRQSVFYFESGSSLRLTLLFTGLTLAGWVVGVFVQPSAVKIHEAYGTLVFVVYFFISYFAFFHLSKLIFRPSEEELEDDTSFFAMFSACRSKERRGWYASLFGATNTVALTIYILISLTGPDAWQPF